MTKHNLFTTYNDSQIKIINKKKFVYTKNQYQPKVAKNIHRNFPNIFPKFPQNLRLSQAAGRYRTDFTPYVNILANRASESYVFSAASTSCTQNQVMVQRNRFSCIAAKLHSLKNSSQPRNERRINQ